MMKMIIILMEAQALVFLRIKATLHILALQEA